MILKTPSPEDSGRRCCEVHCGPGSFHAVAAKTHHTFSQELLYHKQSAAVGLDVLFSFFDVQWVSRGKSYYSYYRPSEARIWKIQCASIEVAGHVMLQEQSRIPASKSLQLE